VALSDDGNGIIVHKKRERGGRFDKHYFTWDQVLAYAEGDGGRGSTAYALVYTNVRILNVFGTLERVREDGLTILRVTDEDGLVHTIPIGVPDPNMDVSVVEEIGDRPGRDRASAADDADDEPDDQDYGDSTEDEDEAEDDFEAEPAPRGRKTTAKPAPQRRPARPARPKPRGRTSAKKPANKPATKRTIRTREISDW
jgi:hypothetical protein